MERLEARRRSLAEGELDFEADEDGNRFAEPGAGHETELSGRLDGFLIEAKHRIERAGHFEIADRAVGQHDAFEADDALYLCAHRLCRVVWPHAAQQSRRFNAVARSVDTTAGTAATALAKPGTLPVADAGALTGAGSALSPRPL